MPRRKKAKIVAEYKTLKAEFYRLTGERDADRHSLTWEINCVAETYTRVYSMWNKLKAPNETFPIDDMLITWVFTRYMRYIAETFFPEDPTQDSLPEVKDEVQSVLDKLHSLPSVGQRLDISDSDRY